MPVRICLPQYWYLLNCNLFDTVADPLMSLRGADIVVLDEFDVFSSSLGIASVS